MIASCLRVLAPIVFACAAAPACCASSGWELASEIVASIEPPRIPDQQFDVGRFGGVADGRSDCRPAVLRAIDACVAAGGGRVVVPPGDWFVKGPIRLRSSVALHIAEGARLRFSSAPEDYLPAVLTRFEGTEVMSYSPPIYAIDQHDVAITGGGVIDGSADDEHWWNWKHSGRDQINRLREMAEMAVPADQRVFEKNELRPSFVQPYRCERVLIEGVTIERSPMWCINPVLCRHVTVRDIRVESHGPNNDGCNPECCAGVLIEGCYFDTGDDCIAIKAGRNADGRRIGKPSENIVVRRCIMRDGHGGVVLGSEMSGGIRNVFVEDCQMSSPNLERAIRLKSNSMRGGYLRNMWVRNVRVGEVSDAVLRIYLRYGPPEEGPHPPEVSAITLENITAEKSERALHLVGLPESPIRGVTLRNCRFAGARVPSVLEHVADVRLEDYSQPVE